jgi:hypothetical protein
MKFFGALLMIAGLLSTILGLIPVVFVYPYKFWDAASQFWEFILFQDGNRLYWQYGILIFFIGLFITIRCRKVSRLMTGEN